MLRDYRKKAPHLMALVLCVIVLSTFYQDMASANADQKQALKKHSLYFGAIEALLEKDGFNKNSISAIYTQPSVQFDPGIVATYFRHRESKLNYNQFLSEKSLNLARKYLQKHENAFKYAEKKFGVDRSVIVAILLVETRLGAYTGKEPVINTLSSIASLKDDRLRTVMWNRLSGESDRKREEFESWALRKSSWAYNELVAFLKYVKKEKLNPIEIRGSFAGAIGFSQFLPSNILWLGKDGNGDNKVDLFSHEDAIHSIANYLRNYGWKPGLDQQEMKKIIFQYNHSSYYVNTVYKIREVLHKS